MILDPHLPRNTFPLNGIWEIAGGEADVIPRTFPSTIHVPSVVDTASPQYDWQAFDFHWYRKTFAIDGLSHTHFVFFKIDQSMFGTEVWLNGHRLGGSISCYTSHEYSLNEFLLPEKENELIVRVGAKRTLPPESAVGRDQEKEIYTPGIWGDVSITCTGGARVKLVQVIPHCASAAAEVRAWIEDLEFTRESLLVSAKIVEKKSRETVSAIHDATITVDGHSVTRVTFRIPIEKMKLWSHESPFLYHVEILLEHGNTKLDASRTAFGMREFTVAGSDFFLNGKKILLRGSNIAFHRFLSDTQRNLLPWDEAWIKKALIDIPKEHHFNFFRNHLGQMYNKWYDIADEYGMLIQNEWQFWCVTGSDTQIRKEFTEWLHDNWNHPSIIIWDPINESSDQTVQREIVPEMKALDPTRPWESVDFLEEHPYIYSLGMVMNDRKFGFTRPLDDIEHLPVPSMVNEFLWWWLNDKWEPTILTKIIVERWMGRTYSIDDVIAHQSFLAQELIELFRRLRVKAIQPFVYISNNDGPTAHWFLGDIKDLRPKPVMQTIKNAFAPFGVSIELWDRHFIAGEQRSLRVFVFNDTAISRSGTVVIGLRTVGGIWLTKQKIDVIVQPMSDSVISADVHFPPERGEYRVAAELEEQGHFVAVSSKIAHVFMPVSAPSKTVPVMVLDPSQEILRYCEEQHLPSVDGMKEFRNDVATIIIHGNVLGNGGYHHRKESFTQFVQSGGKLILIEPEFRTVGDATTSVVDGVDLIISHRQDVDKGGYDSYVFAEDHAHPLWNGIQKEHLKIFNGAYGGEIVSQYDVAFSVPSTRLASCGIDLAVAAASEVNYGKGKIILFRLQLRGRLIESAASRSLFGRRADPVARQLFLNLLDTYH